MTKINVKLDGGQQRLLDINDDFHYFESDILVKGKGFAGILSQEDLDNGASNLEEIQNDEYSVSINNIDRPQKYQNYFLCLKSNEPTQLDVSIDTREIDPKVVEQNVEPEPEPPQTLEGYESSSKGTLSFYTRVILAIIVVVIGVILLKKFSK